MKTIRMTLLIASLTMTACTGDPPEVYDLTISTSPVTRGQQASGLLSVRDEDGLRDVDLEARILEPLVSPVPFTVPSFSDEDVDATIAFVLVLSDSAPVGPYRMGVRAIDVDGMESEEVVVDFDVQ